jgi:hypothetical protein
LKYVDPSGFKPTVWEAAIMAENIYSAGDKDKGTLISNGNGWGLEDIITNDFGLKMGVYSKIKLGGTKEYSLVNKGTSLPENWADNVGQPLGMSDDMDDSIEKSEYFVASHSDSEITMVGHSKGGAEAIANAVANNKNAITFNPAKPNLGMFALDKDSYSATMTHYVVTGEVLNTVFGEPSIGNVVYLPKVYDYTYHAWYNNSISDYINELIDNHGMGAVIMALQEAGYKY